MTFTFGSLTIGIPINGSKAYSPCSHCGLSSSIAISDSFCDRLVDLGEGASTEPNSEIGFELPASCDGQLAAILGKRNCRVAHPDFSHAPKIGSQV